MAPVDRDKVRHHVQYVRGNLRLLGEIRASGRESFLANATFQAATIRYLQTAVEALIDIANHIIARQGLGLPRSYGEAVRILVENDILPRDKEQTFLDMVRFRNRAVHLYDDLDPAEVFDIVERHLEDFEAYLAPVVERYFDEP